jgi:methylthioribulose-1-phosphate dehydratase
MEAESFKETRCGNSWENDGSGEVSGLDSRVEKSMRSAGAAEDAGAAEKFAALASELVALGRKFYERRWVLGTSGNFSAVLSREPMRLAITSSGLDKGALDASSFIEMDENARVVGGSGKPSAEALLHVAIVRELGAGAVLHTHSVWSTVLSGAHATRGGIEIHGYEMLKGLEGVRTHEHREWLSILENSQDMTELSERVAKLLRENRGLHGFLLREHGLYTWGATVQEAKRHVEILEFLMEVLVRAAAMPRPTNAETGD